MTAVDLSFASAAELGRLYRAGAASPLEALDACLARIDQANPLINAYVTVDRDGARADARQAQEAFASGRRLPPLTGVPVGIKDLSETAGMRTTYGSTLYADNVPTEDALVVRRLREAGAIILGKTNTPEFGAGSNTFNDVFGATRNPWDAALTAGGSSGGSAAALACGMSPLCEGSDTGGSLRTPASFCGVVGLRSSAGLVPMRPDGMPWEGLSIVGPMSRTIEDAALMLSCIAGRDARAPLSYDVDATAFPRAAASPSAAGARIGWSEDLGGLLPVDPEVAAICEGAVRALEGAGATVDAAHPDLSQVRPIILATRGIGFVAAFEDLLPEHREALQPGIVWNVEQGLALTPSAIADAVRKRAALWESVLEFFEDHDLLALPTVAIPPFPVELPWPREVNGRAMDDYTHWFSLTYAITVTGLPVIAVPAGFTRAGLPVGLQLVGRHRGEAELLRLAAELERVQPWRDRRPPLVAAS